MFVLNLIRNPDGKVLRSSVELITEVYHTRINLKGTPNLTAVFADGFRSHLEDIISRASRTRMLMLTDFFVQLEDLVIQGCRVLFSAADHGFEYVMVRFNSVKGRFNRIFKDPYGLPQLPESGDAHLGKLAIEGVLLPLFNFAAHIDSMLNARCLSTPEKQLLQSVNREIGKLHYSSDLLGYLEACKSISQERPAHTLDETGYHSTA